MIYSMSPKVAVISLNGLILTEKTSSFVNSEITSSKEFRKHIEDILKDDTYKAVILDINSPGGTPIASDEISKSILELKKNKLPVYAIINDLGTSGAYWVAVSADKIYANEMSLVGSIGVLGSSFGFENFIENLNITHRRFVSGKFKDMRNPFRKPTEEENEKWQELLDEIHRIFINYVAKSRNLSFENVKEIATGEVFLGNKAKELKLIDEIGSIKDVKEIIEKELQEKPLYIEFGPKKSFLEEIGLNSINLNIPDLNSNHGILLK
jgi:protease IV